MSRYDKFWDYIFETFEDSKRNIIHAINQPEDAWYYIQGRTRILLWRFIPFLIRKHIEEQFIWRLKAGKLCTENGSCLACGCSIKKGLYFANKACGKSKIKDAYVRKSLTGDDKICYPKMMNKYNWELYKLKNKIKL